MRLKDLQIKYEVNLPNLSDRKGITDYNPTLPSYAFEV
jgi:hypothetical protein